MVSHRKHKTVGAHLLTKILPKDNFRTGILMIEIKEVSSRVFGIRYFEFGSPGVIGSISSDISALYVIHKGLVHYPISPLGWIITSKIPIAGISGTGFV